MFIYQHFMANCLRPIILAFELSLVPRPQSALFLVVKKGAHYGVVWQFVVGCDCLRSRVSAIIVPLHISDEVASEVVRFVNEQVRLCSKHKHIFRYLQLLWDMNEETLFCGGWFPRSVTHYKGARPGGAIVDIILCVCTCY